MMVSVTSAVCYSTYWIQLMSVPCTRRGGRRCCRSPRRCPWACPRLPWACCTGTEWWNRLCHWNIWSLPRTALAPPNQSPSGFSPQAYRQKHVERQTKQDDPPVLSDQRNQLKQVLYKLFGTLSPFFFLHEFQLSISTVYPLLLVN